MIGAALILVALLIVIPLGVMLTGAVLSILTSATMTAEAEAAHEGSELIDLNT
ncbi:MAG TPA: hypothetical protein VGA13_04205 [Acidimicrobiales bacterium]